MLSSPAYGACCSAGSPGRGCGGTACGCVWTPPPAPGYPSPSRRGFLLSTADQILDAAAVEFAARGLDGTRMVHVARGAGVNKALAYRHFHDKNGLFSATLSRELTRRQKILDELPDTLGETLILWARRQKADMAFIRLVAEKGCATPVMLEQAPLRHVDRKSVV